ncbi:hypothetical protein H6P81_016557 [Aristolochia fimbriata]|uniref:PORR domain-containing protein n=1 Tax=Aristolochia fimbriata TaxID=158543 RepID=A0AAV7EBV3_ARIFI|nr:hypothetical protein H6P81_016557 [Aristolochia fimbriata]
MELSNFQGITNKGLRSACRRLEFGNYAATCWNSVSQIDVQSVSLISGLCYSSGLLQGIEEFTSDEFTSVGLQRRDSINHTSFTENGFSYWRWRKPAVTAQTRLEDRTRDLRLDKLMRNYKRLNTVLKLHELMSNWRGHYVSVQLMSKWKNSVGMNVGIGAFLRKYPHIFDIYTHPIKRNLCCKLTKKMVDLMKEEAEAIQETELLAVQRVKKLLMISTSGTLHIHSLWLVRQELGLPDDFRHSILPKYSEDFRIENFEIVGLISRDESLVVAEVEEWREKEYSEKWLSEYETKYAFPVNFPTGFKIEKGYREKLKNWQRLRYFKPYDRLDSARPRSCGGVEGFEKRAVGILHEFLSLTIEKMVEVERLSHFRKDFSIETNIRELLLRHPGIFYISTKGSTQTVFLREAFLKGCLIEPNQVYAVRRKMLDLIVLGCRNIRDLHDIGMKESSSEEEGVDLHDEDWVIPVLESLDCQHIDVENESNSTSYEESDRSSYHGRFCFPAGLDDM